ncbi:MAG: CDP-diacylglycerol--glycerol-3-phosphate 3-phosphatidyltransferase [Oscillospiraceae bacterium]|nr:CDP-diacylglycerol--glycerol-3-phosphate 3-phosphatidyltransferase [Oscillospiraceae bacterium]
MFKTTANKITMLRIVLIPVFLVLAYSDKMMAALAVYVIACLSDFADGYIARHFNQISNFGKFMDPLADKMLVLAAMCFFVENGQMAGWAVAVVLFREFAVSGMRLLAVEQGQVIAAAWSGKIKTASTMVCLILMMLMNNNVLNIVSTVIIVATTVYSGVEYFYVNRAVFKEAD